jgi:hypothetical protein
MFLRKIIVIFNEIRDIVLSFPGVEEYLAFGRPTWRLNGRLLACITKIDPDTLCVKVLDQLERDFLLNTQPDIYYLTPQYANFEALLVRIPNVEADDLRGLIEQVWLAYAPKRLLRAYREEA